jgi:subtilisin family serine protease
MKLLFAVYLLLLASIGFGSVGINKQETSAAPEDEYIVVLKPSSNLLAFKPFSADEGKVLKKLDIINGMVVKTDVANAMKIQNNPSVAYVEKNKKMYALGTQSNPPWGLDRIDSKAGLDGKYVYSKTGANVNVYVIDTGVRSTHTEFSGRVKSGYTAINDGKGTNDCQGHGTHVSGTIAGKTYGVAKNANIYPVRVLGCDGSGTNDGVIAGINWVANNARKPAVANMSLGGSFSQAVNDAVTNAIAKGVVFVVAAGNSNDDACGYSPASTPSAITVAASDRNDNSASFTSYGRCVDIWGPGVDILSAGIGNDSDTDTMSGTSMATPHAAGVAALYLEASPSATPGQIASSMVNLGSKNVIKNPKGSANVLIYTNPDNSNPNPNPTPTPNPNPTTPPDCVNKACYFKKDRLANSSAYHVHPMEYVYVPANKTLKAWVKGNADFDLYMYLFNNNQWTLLTKSDGTGGDESVSYQAQGGYYYSWVVVLKAPNTTGGDYSVWISY